MKFHALHPVFGILVKVVVFKEESLDFSKFSLQNKKDIAVVAILFYDGLTTGKLNWVKWVYQTFDFLGDQAFEVWHASHKFDYGFSLFVFYLA